MIKSIGELQANMHEYMLNYLENKISGQIVLPRNKEACKKCAGLDNESHGPIGHDGPMGTCWTLSSHERVSTLNHDGSNSISPLTNLFFIGI